MKKTCDIVHEIKFWDIIRFLQFEQISAKAGSEKSKWSRCFSPKINEYDHFRPVCDFGLFS